MLSALLSKPFPSTIIALAALLLMPWPGYVLLHLAGLGRHRWSAVLFVAPAVTLALWIVVLSGAAWASIPLKDIFGPVWIATLALAALGVALRLSIRRKLAASARPQREQIALWAVAAVLPFVVMPAALRFGLADFANSTYSDPWSYVMVSDYLSHVARGAEGGLAALHQYAAHLMNTRNASSALLAHLAYGLGGVKADQTMVLFCLLLLFANVATLIGFALTVFRRSEAALSLAILAGLGWPANVVFAGNFDQLLVLPLLPAIATFACRAGTRMGLVAASLFIGLLCAAALLAYVELAFIGVLVAMTFVIAPTVPLGRAIGRALIITCIALPVLVLLSWPAIGPLMVMLKSQYVLTTAATARPGDGYFMGLPVASRLPDSLWALGGEFGRARGIILPWLLGAMLTALFLIGIWRELRRWAVMLGVVVVAAAVTHFTFREHYSYATYKIISINAWMMSALAIAGGLWLAPRLKPRLPRQLTLTMVITALLLAIAIDRTVVQSGVIRFKQNALQQRAYREAELIAAKVQQAPTLMAVRDDLPNEWAVFHLSDMPLLIAPYRIYMAQAHVVPFMERSMAVDPASIRYIVTDRNDATRASVTGARRIWDGQCFSLWEVNAPEWVVLADIINPNGIEPGGLWLGGNKTEFLVVTGRSGSASLDMTLQPGPRAAPNAVSFHATVSDAAGSRKRDLSSGETRIPLDLAAGRSIVSLGLDEPPAASPPASGDARPLILRMTDYRLTRSSAPAQ